MNLLSSYSILYVSISSYPWNVNASERNVEQRVAYFFQLDINDHGWIKQSSVNFSKDQKNIQYLNWI